MATIPLAPRTARAIDLAIGERIEGPIFLGSDGSRLERHAAGRISRRVARGAGIAKRVGPHTLRYAFITAAPTPRRRRPLAGRAGGGPAAYPRITMRYERCRQSLTATTPASWPRPLPVPLAEPDRQQTRGGSPRTRLVGLAIRPPVPALKPEWEPIVVLCHSSVRVGDPPSRRSVRLADLPFLRSPNRREPTREFRSRPGGSQTLS